MEDDSTQTIYFYGKNKEQLFLQLAKDVIEGKKHNQKELSQKINVPISNEIRVGSDVDLLRKIGVDDNTLEEFKTVAMRLEKLHSKCSEMEENDIDTAELQSEIDKLYYKYEAILKDIIKRYGGLR